MLDLLKPEAQVLGTELGASGGAANPLKYFSSLEVWFVLDVESSQFQRKVKTGSWSLN